MLTVRLVSSPVWQNRMNRLLTLIALYVLLPLGACGQGTEKGNAMDDESQIRELHEQMYKAMVAKDIATLDKLHADDFVLTHMTGMRQSKAVYLEAIRNGTLNYYSAEMEQLDIKVYGDSAVMTSRSRVLAAVFGGGKHTWPLQLRFTMRKDTGRWQLTSASASTY